MRAWSIRSFTSSILRHIMALNRDPPHAAKCRILDGSPISACDRPASGLNPTMWNVVLR